jgi:D-alanyl-D-alanine carboxypeptidase
MLLIEADSGKVLHAENATHPWYPASLTKLMTAYVTLQAVKSGRLTLDTLLTVSARAHEQQPSKMGFPPGTQITVDNALKMLMVKSANDVAVVLAEGVSGSVEKFADEMNAHAQRLGMTQSSFVNPNGLPADNQITSARDLAILARATYRDFPGHQLYWNIAAIKFGKKVLRNYNTLIGRYPGADGMKTGFICASGFNLVASATRDGKRLIAVVLGSPSSPVRGAKTAALLERGFNRNGLSWLTPSLGTVNALPVVNSDPPDLREQMCGKHRKRPAAEEADEEPTTSAGNQADPNSPTAFMLSSLPPVNGKPSALLGPVQPIVNPVVVYTGAAKTAAEAQVAATRAKVQPAKTAIAGKASKGAKPSQTAAAPAKPAVPAAAPQTTAATASPAALSAAAPSQISAAPAAQVGPPTGQFTRQNGNRTMPSAADSATGPWLSFAPPARADTPPLTAAPAAGPQTATVPAPRPRPKPAAPKPAAPKP